MYKEDIDSMLNYFYEELSNYINHDADALIHNYTNNKFREAWNNHIPTGMEIAFNNLKHLLIRHRGSEKKIEWFEINDIFKKITFVIDSIPYSYGDDMCDFTISMRKRYSRIRKFISDLHEELSQNIEE